jgi:hypothetical protein
MRWTETITGDEWRCGKYRIERFEHRDKPGHSDNSMIAFSRGYMAISRPRKTLESAKASCRRERELGSV